MLLHSQKQQGARSCGWLELILHPSRVHEGPIHVWKCPFKLPLGIWKIDVDLRCLFVVGLVASFLVRFNYLLLVHVVGLINDVLVAQENQKQLGSSSWLPTVLSSGPSSRRVDFATPFSLRAWILSWSFWCHFVLRLKGRKNPLKKFTQKFITKSTLPELKYITVNALQKGSSDLSFFLQHGDFMQIQETA